MRSFASRPRRFLRGGPRSYDGGTYRIESRWKEEVVYWEGERGFVFNAAWGVRPPILYLPSDRLWDRAVPDWLKWRRVEVVQRLSAHSGHVVEETDKGYERPPRGRSGRDLAPVANLDEALQIVHRQLEHFMGILEDYALLDTPHEEDAGWLFVLKRRDRPSADDRPTPVAETIRLLVRRDTGEIAVLGAASSLAEN
jgi:hypothetical protein